MLILLIAVCALLLTTTTEGPAARVSINNLSFMSGSWAAEQNGRRVEEHWTAPRGGMMLATAVTISEGKAVFFEFLRVEETADGIFYQAQPRGRPATAFKLVALTTDKAVFENSENDFPQRITYWRADGNLWAKIEGRRDGKHASEEWKFQPTTLNGD